MKAFEKAFNLGLLSRTITTFDGTEEVVVTGTAPFAGLIQVRKAGDISEYWLGKSWLTR
jgi:hypothetical protein